MVIRTTIVMAADHSDTKNNEKISIVEMRIIIVKLALIVIIVHVQQ